MEGRLVTIRHAWGWFAVGCVVSLTGLILIGQSLDAATSRGENWLTGSLVWIGFGLLPVAGETLGISVAQTVRALRSRQDRPVTIRVATHRVTFLFLLVNFAAVITWILLGNNALYAATLGFSPIVGTVALIVVTKAG